jgi:hypothetical protein
VRYNSNLIRLVWFSGALIMIVWTRDRLAQLPDNKIRTLRDNALRNGRIDVSSLCDAELMSRRSPRRAGSAIVKGFHFVCPREIGVTKYGDGTAWTGTWVVDKRKVPELAHMSLCIPQSLN